MFLLMFCVVLLLPAVMVIFGGIWQRHPPKEINDVYGYRTAMSMKNIDTWNFAHRLCGRLWMWSGGASLLLSAAAMVVFRADVYLTVGWVLSIQVVIMLLAIPATEVSLRRHFDQDGRPK